MNYTNEHNDITRYFLEPRYDSRQSFYKKAIVTIEGNRKTLVSYSTRVVTIIDNKVTVHGTYSPTTLRHIKEFLKQFGFTADSKAQIEKDYMQGGEA